MCNEKSIIDFLLAKLHRAAAALPLAAIAAAYWRKRERVGVSFSGRKRAVARSEWRKRAEEGGSGLSGGYGEWKSTAKPGQ